MRRQTVEEKGGGQEVGGAPRRGVEGEHVAIEQAQLATTGEA